MLRRTKPVAPDAPRARRALRALPSVLFYVAAAVVAWFIWPTSLGGCTTLTLVSGHSMEPTYVTGDIVVARCGEPAVGDVVVYQPDEVEGNARIIHRIVGQSDAGWVMQGDNNEFLDPFEPTNDEVLGVARVHIPKVGLVVQTFSNAWIWIAMIALALALLVWPSTDDESDSPDDERDDTPGDGAGPDETASGEPVGDELALAGAARGPGRAVELGPSA